MRRDHALLRRAAPLVSKNMGMPGRRIQRGFGALAAVLSYGCSSDPSSAWVGLYDIKGERSIECGASSATATLGGSVNLGFGVSSGVFQGTIDACSLQWRATDTTAALESGQSCIVTVDGARTAVSLSSGTAVVSGANDVSMDFSGSAENGCRVAWRTTLTLVPVRLCRRDRCGYVGVTPDGT